MSMDYEKLVAAVVPTLEKIVDRVVPGEISTMVTAITAIRAILGALRMAKAGQVTPEMALSHAKKLAADLKENDESADGALVAKFKGKK